MQHLLGAFEYGTITDTRFSMITGRLSCVPASRGVAVPISPKRYCITNLRVSCLPPPPRIDFGFLSEIVQGAPRPLPNMTSTGLQGSVVANAQLEVPKFVKVGKGKGARTSMSPP
jgi:hypothetical protein